MNTLTDFEKECFELYTNYSKSINSPKAKELDNKWTKDGTKEKTWISIYNKMNIEYHLETLLFNPMFDEGTVITEMEDFIKTNHSRGKYSF